MMGTSGLRARTRIGVLAIAAAVSLSVLVVPASAATTSRGRIQVWNANLRKMNHRHSPRLWKKFVLRMDEHQRKPDLIALNEVCNMDFGGAPGNDARQFVSYLERVIGRNYSWRHAAKPGTPCTQANSMVVWRTQRFKMARRDNTTRWRALTDVGSNAEGTCTRRDGHNLEQIAVALWDRLQRRAMVFSSIHIQVIDARECINENILVMDRVLERLRARRPLTVVGGDFNQTPQRESAEPGDEVTAGMEVDQACWYRSLSMLTFGDRIHCTEGPQGLDHHRRSTDRYLDSVQVQHQSPLTGQNVSGICDEWTHSKMYSGRGTACTDISGSEDVPDGWADRGRIDYIFARWERPGGKARRFSIAEAAQLIAEAGAEKSPPPRYSDHRAVHALVRWCLPTEDCRKRD